MDTVIVLGALGSVCALLVVGGLTRVFRGREFSTHPRYIDSPNGKLAEREVRLNALQGQISNADASLVEARAELEGLAKLEQELDYERRRASDLSRQILRMK